MTKRVFLISEKIKINRQIKHNVDFAFDGNKRLVEFVLTKPECKYLLKLIKKDITRQRALIQTQKIERNKNKKDVV